MKTSVGVRHPDGRVERVSELGGVFYQACICPDGSSVLYAGAFSGPPRIWRSDLGDGVEPVALTPGDSGARHPVWSWAGDRIAFTSDRDIDVETQTVEQLNAQGAPTAGNIFTMGPDGDDAVQLTRGHHADQRPTFSPDGSTIVFVSDRDDRIGLWQISAHEPNEPAPLAYRGFAYRPWFSVDGQSLFCFCDIDGRHQVCELRLDDPVPSPLANDDRGRTHGPFADPGGEVLLVHSTRGSEHHGIYELPLDGAPMRRIEIPGVDHPMHATRSRNGLLAFDVLDAE